MFIQTVHVARGYVQQKIVGVKKCYLLSAFKKFVGLPPLEAN